MINLLAPEILTPSPGQWIQDLMNWESEKTRTPIEQMINVVTKIPCGQLPAERFRSDPTVDEKLNDRILIKYKTRPNIIVKGKDYGCA